MNTKFVFSLLLGGLLAGTASAQTSGVIVANATYSTPVTLSGPLTAVGSLTFQKTLDGRQPLVVAGDLTALGDIGSITPVGAASLAGRFTFDAQRFHSAGVVTADGTTELRQPGAELTAASWVLAGQIRLPAAGTYTLRATSGRIVLAGQLIGPTSGKSVLRLVAPQGSVEIRHAVPGSVEVLTFASEPPPGDPVEMPTTAGRLINLSARGIAGTGDQALIIGFVVRGGDRPVLVRTVGPTLGRFGVAGALARPQFTVFDAANRTVASVCDWTALPEAARAELRTAAMAAGGVALGETAPDAAALLRLPAGVYSMVVSGAGGESGVVLAEVYEVE